mmetsp:Transcript_30276/g.48569  ORF Transcript_30276/g.48569 Transcript_30276/m.48569 type:complete len:199 (-) Transcript_30276:369-965(-)
MKSDSIQITSVPKKKKDKKKKKKDKKKDRKKKKKKKKKDRKKEKPEHKEQHWNAEDFKNDKIGVPRLIAQDGNGVCEKTILKFGTGRKPEKGQEVALHCVGTMMVWLHVQKLLKLNRNDDDYRRPIEIEEEILEYTREKGRGAQSEALQVQGGYWEGNKRMGRGCASNATRGNCENRGHWNLCLWPEGKSKMGNPTKL